MSRWSLWWTHCVVTGDAGHPCHARNFSPYDRADARTVCTVAGGGGPDLTTRESAVLGAVERRLGNADIAAELHISVRTVESHIAALRRKLAVDSRAGLIDAARARRGSTVPVPQNSFVGRDQDLAAVRDLLVMDRFVSLVGPAGSGKTRLAMELASRDDRVPLVVELEHARPDNVLRWVAKAVGMGTDAADDLVGATGTSLAAQDYLLVLDNCERVTDGVARLVADLLAMAGRLRVLATSRSPIGGAAETVYALEPLDVAAADDGAVRLFVDRARAASPATTLPADDDDLALIRRVCERLDGLPLAIELAAARMRHLSLAELADRLDAGFGAIDRSGRAGRHATLESAFAWSWEMLDDEERRVLVRLAALPRTFDLELAEAVAGPGSGDVTLRLLDRSLVSVALQATPTRFRLLESLRAYVLDRAPEGTVPEVRDAHAAYHRSLAGAFAEHARTDDSLAAAETAALLCPEINAAVDWSLDQHPDLALSLACTLSVGGEQYGPDIASLNSIARTARHPAVRQMATPQELFELGAALAYVDLDLMAELADLCRAKAAAGGPADELAAEHLAGHAAAYRHEPEAALVHFARAEQLADELLDMWHLGHIRQMRGIAYRDLGDYESAMASFESAMHTFGLAGDAMHVNNSLYMMAANAVPAGRPAEQAVTWVERCVDYSRRSLNRHEYAHAVLTRAQLVPRDDAEADLREAVEVFRSVGDLRCLTRAFLRLADDRPPAVSRPLLEQALGTATRARDREHQAIALQRLAAASWEAGAGHEAAVAYGGLAQLVGDDEAAGRCPDGLVAAALDAWPAAVAQGRGRFLTASGPVPLTAG